MARMSGVLVILALLASAPALAAEEPQRAQCAHDREAILELEFAAFDQTMESGWRPLYEAGCYQEAAALLRDWAARHEQVPSIVPFHEAQLWGYAGRSDLAIAMFERIHRETSGEDRETWKLYTEGNLAFLQRDRARLEAATAKLAAAPRPATWGNAVDVHGNPVQMAWPPNLNVMQALLRCWDETYEVAAHCHVEGWRSPAGER